MHVRVLEAGQHHPAGDMQHLGTRPDELAHVRRAQGDHPVSPHGDGVAACVRPVDEVHGGTGHDEVGGRGHAVARKSSTRRLSSAAASTS